MDIEIKPLSTDVIDDFLYFFDKIGFVDNPDWASCYCQFYHFNGSREDWLKTTKEQNRDASIELIRSGKMKGFIAYVEGKPIGWCNANSRENYLNLPYTSDRKNKGISLVCFLISHHHRRAGIAKMLLRYACQYYKNNGYDYIEVYPRKNVSSDAHNYHGPYSLFISEGFSIISELEQFYVMQKDL